LGTANTGWKQPFGIRVAPFWAAQALSAFTGKAINGAWKLKVRDLAAADTGTLNFWEIDFRTN
jgi:subtilisin-like proprotein convertase family protein